MNESSFLVATKSPNQKWRINLYISYLQYIQLAVVEKEDQNQVTADHRKVFYVSKYLNSSAIMAKLMFVKRGSVLVHTD